MSLILFPSGHKKDSPCDCAECRRANNLDAHAFKFSRCLRCGKVFEKAFPNGPPEFTCAPCAGELKELGRAYAEGLPNGNLPSGLDRTTEPSRQVAGQKVVLPYGIRKQLVQQPKVIDND